MSSSPKVLAVRAHMDRLDNNNFDNFNQYITDDFLYEAESKPMGVLGEGYGDEAGIDQVGLKAFREKIAGHLTFKTTIENITENQAGKVIVSAKAKYQQIMTASSPTPPYTGEVPFTAEYEFVGDKIRKMKKRLSRLGIVRDSATYQCTVTALNAFWCTEAEGDRNPSDQPPRWHVPRRPPGYDNAAASGIAWRSLELTEYEDAEESKTSDYVVLFLVLVPAGTCHTAGKLPHRGLYASIPTRTYYGVDGYGYGVNHPRVYLCYTLLPVGGLVTKVQSLESVVDQIVCATNVKYGMPKTAHSGQQHGSLNFYP
ncbi:hypothetical protein DFH29DRAFT_1052263 [Suillus ampliporus]|nr:hypothetical protein DFH29DRAFT_1052263 [Suillus ampliporus]